jgi:hypothetical protein
MWARMEGASKTNPNLKVNSCEDQFRWEKIFGHYFISFILFMTFDFIPIFVGPITPFWGIYMV